MPGTPPCAAGDRCVETSDSCETSCEIPDGDGDGVDDIECGGTDCDDTDASRYPGAIEICDALGVDEDCDPLTFGGLDRDGDGAFDAACCNGSECGTDCDDYRADVGPTATEACNQRDDDCDGDVDEGVAIDGYADTDGDLYGDPDAPLRGCAGWPGISSSDLDCDDGSPMVHGAQPEVLDGLDNDCDGTTDEEPETQTWYRDADGDGFGDPSGPTMSSDATIEGYSLLRTDCDDGDGERNPAATELCNGVDDDCDGRTMFAIGPNDGEDDDGDGYPDALCPGVDGAVADCNDRDPTAHPDAFDSCNGRDDDCDAAVDERCAAPMDMGPCDGVCDSPADVLANCGCPDSFACLVQNDTYACRLEGSSGSGGACTTANDCAAGHVCTRGLCREICDTVGGVCIDDRYCSRTLTIPAAQGLPDTLGVCTIDCDPIADTGCGGDTCRLAATGVGYFPYCSEPGAVAFGSGCSFNADCEPGAICDMFDGPGRECIAMCPAICPAGYDCTGVILTFADGTPFQFCQPPLT